MNINFTDECPCELPTLGDLEPGDLFEHDYGEGDPRAVYLIVDSNREQIGKHSGYEISGYTQQRRKASIKRQNQRQIDKGFIPHYVIDLKFNRYMPANHFKANERVRKLCGQLNVNRES